MFQNPNLRVTNRQLKGVSPNSYLRWISEPATSADVTRAPPVDRCEHADDDDAIRIPLGGSTDARERAGGFFDAKARRREEADVQDADADAAGDGWRSNANSGDDADAVFVVVRGGTDGGGNGTDG